MTRDKNRTPMQWSSRPNAGFSPPAVEPWLPVNPDFGQGVNVEDQQDDPDSLLSYYRALLAVRRASPALTLGAYVTLQVAARDYFAFLRRSDSQDVLVVLNYSAKRLALDLASQVAEQQAKQVLRTLFSSVGRVSPEESAAALPISPFEVYIAEVSG
jgi:alpha-glucosidase